MSSIKVSYILPCYNTGKYLRRCVESLLDQGFNNEEYEIICVNNAATDNTQELLADLSSSFPVVKVVNLLVNQCSGGAYNAGVDIAQGKYVQFVDSDDYIKRGSVLRLYNLMESKSLEMLYFNIESFSGDDQLTHIDDLVFNGNIKNDINVTSGDGFLSEFLNSHEVGIIPVPAYRKIILREKLLESEIRFSHTTIGTDFVHNIELLSKFTKIAAICDKLYMFRYNPDGVTKSKMTSSKIVYALNNYSKAFEIVQEAKWRESNKEIIHKELINTINYYLSFIRLFNSEEFLWIYQQLYHIKTIQVVAQKTTSKFFLKYPKIYSEFIKIMPAFFIKIAYRIIN